LLVPLPQLLSPLSLLLPLPLLLLFRGDRCCCRCLARASI
jgi:hypothetical protein